MIMILQKIITTLKALVQWVYKAGKVHKFLQKIARARVAGEVKVLNARLSR